MLGSNLVSACQCNNCCPDSYGTSVERPSDNLPDSIFFQYSGVPSFIEPNFEFTHTDVDVPPGGSYVKERKKHATHNVVSWSGVVNRLVIGSTKTDEYFKIFPQGQRPSFTISGTNTFVVVERGGGPFGGGNPNTITEKSFSKSFSKHFEIVGVYVAPIRIATRVGNDSFGFFAKNEYLMDYPLACDRPNTPTHPGALIHHGCRFRPFNQTDCCYGHGNPGCGNHLCRDEVASINPACLKTNGFPVNGSCYIAHGTPGCDKPTCCTYVCQQPGFEYCCDNSTDSSTWDFACAQKATEICDKKCGSEDWFFANNRNCQDIVCDIDPFCCTRSWDSICAGLAQDNCGCPKTMGEGSGEKGLPANSPNIAWFADIIIEAKSNFAGGSLFEGGERVFDGLPFNKNTPPDIDPNHVPQRLPGLSGDFDPANECSNGYNSRYTSVRAISGRDNQFVAIAPDWTPNILPGGTSAFTPAVNGIMSVLRLEDFDRLGLANASQRKQYLVPARVEEFRLCNTINYNPERDQSPSNVPNSVYKYYEPFVTEFIDYNKFVDACHQGIIPYAFPSSPIRQNDNTITTSLTNGDLSLPYGVYNANIAIPNFDVKSTTCACFDCDQRLCNPGSCCEVSNGFPGCPYSSDCEKAVCADPSTAYCCDPNSPFGWDNVCATKALSLPDACECIACGSPNTGDCFSTHNTPYCNDAGCCQSVCAFEPQCCSGPWGAECVELAQFLCGGFTGPSNFKSTPSNVPTFCNPELYVGTSMQTTCRLPYQNCNINYDCNSAIADGKRNGPQYPITRNGNANFKCGYEYLQTPSCFLTERPISSIFSSPYLPEEPNITYFKDSAFSSATCSNYDETKEKAWCFMPDTDFPKTRELWRSRLFATSTTIIISPVPPVP